MKKHFMKILTLCLALAMCLSLAACGGEKTEEQPPVSSAETAAPSPEPETPSPEPETPSPEPEASPETEAEAQPEAEKQELDMSKALFIGDSRTVGLYEYAQLPSEFFADSGMSVYNIFDNYADVGGRGFTQLRPLLENYDYSYIFLMLGLNEIGFPFDEVMEKYEILVDYLREAEPEAKLIIMANLHVTTEYSDGHPYITNPNINALNELMSGCADGEDILYLDVSGVFDDENGGLKSELTSDGVHFYAVNYMEWGQWIKEQTELLINK